MPFENHMFHITGKQNVIWKSYVSHNWHSKWNAQCTSSLLKYFLGVLSRIQYPVSMIVQYPVSSIQYPVSMIVQYPVSSIRDCPVSSIQYPWLSSIQYPASMIVQFLYNRVRDFFVILCQIFLVGKAYKKLSEVLI